VFKKRLVYILLSVLVSVGLLWLLLSSVKTEDIVQTVSRIFIPALLIYMATALTAAWLRAWRYKLLLRPQPISWPNMFLVTFIRNSLIDLLPARIGSLSYIYVLNKRLGFPFETATSSFVLAFILDFLTLSPFLIVSLLAVGLGANSLSTPLLLLIAAAFFLLIFLVYWQLIPAARFFLAVFRRVLRLGGLEERASARTAVQKFELTIQSLNAVRLKGQAVPIFILSLFIRLAKYISVYALFFGLLRSHGFSLGDLSFWTFILGLSGAELTSVLPIKGLAGFGTWESAWALTFRLMNFDPRLAVISGIGVHLLTNVFEYSLGIASILILAWPYLRKKRNP
jgi:glycosyltransferase 2 family protein